MIHLIVPLTVLTAGPSVQEGVEFFEKKIRPVLVEHCYECHSGSARELRGGLMLDSRWGWESGGESGPPIVPGEPEASLILEALRYESFEMPPKGKLPGTVIADFEKWIEMGAPDPRPRSTHAAKTDAVDLEARKSDFRGTLIPAYSFNSALGSIPLVGLLFSPERGGGLFAATFNVIGSLDRPAFMFNPLAVLAPGFLRGLLKGIGKVGDLPDTDKTLLD